MAELDVFITRRCPGISRFGMNLVCREGVNNALKHGNGMRPELPVRVLASAADDVLRVVIEDQGEGWDWVAHECMLPEMECESGRGLFLIKSYARSLEYNDKGNQLTIVLDGGGKR